MRLLPQYSWEKMSSRLNRHLTKEDIQMGNKHMKRFPTLYVIREMEIKTRCHYRPVRMTKSGTVTSNASDDVEQWEGFLVAYGSEK